MVSLSPNMSSLGSTRRPINSHIVPPPDSPYSPSPLSRPMLESQWELQSPITPQSDPVFSSSNLTPAYFSPSLSLPPPSSVPASSATYPSPTLSTSSPSPSPLPTDTYRLNPGD